MRTGSVRRHQRGVEATVTQGPEHRVGYGNEAVDERERGDRVTQRLEHGVGLQAGEGGARADVRTGAERQVLTRPPAVNAEPFRLGEHRLVPVGRGDAEHDAIAAMEGYTPDLGVGQDGA